MSERRYSNQELALILRRAVELEEKPGTFTESKGIALPEIQEIAREAGISPEQIARAIAELETRGSLEPFSLLGPKGVKREMRTLVTQASQEDLKELVRIIDEHIQAQGTVSEALGVIRWNGSDRFLNSQVALEPSDEGLHIRIEEKIPHKLRSMLHFIPGSYAAFIAAALAAQGDLAAPLIALLGLSAGAGGLALGGMVWRYISKRSSARVRALMDKLVDHLSKKQTE